MLVIHPHASSAQNNTIDSRELSRLPEATRAELIEQVLLDRQRLLSNLRVTTRSRLGAADREDNGSLSNVRPASARLNEYRVIDNSYKMSIEHTPAGDTAPLFKATTTFDAHEGRMKGLMTHRQVNHPVARIDSQHDRVEHNRYLFLLGGEVAGEPVSYLAHALRSKDDWRIDADAPDGLVKVSMGAPGPVGTTRRM